MQGIVFTYRKRKSRNKTRQTYRKDGVKRFFRRWGGIIFFAVMFVLGLSVGCIMSSDLSDSTLKNLDFLFMTNMPERLSGGAINAFCAGFASDFLFLAAAFILGLSLWGVAALPFIAFFKGFGVGVSAGYLLTAYGFKGIVFYVTVLLPGIAVFAMALIYELNAALGIFRRLYLTLFGKAKRDFREPVRMYLKSSLKYLIITFAAAVVDAALWIGLAGLFF